MTEKYHVFYFVKVYSIFSIILSKIIDNIFIIYYHIIYYIFIKRMFINFYEYNIHILPSEHIAYKIVPSIMLSGIKPNALIYIIWAKANMHIPGVKQLGQTNNASPIQLNINPVNIRLEKVYLKIIRFICIFKY